MSDSDDLSITPDRIVVTGGGTPTAAELAAVIVALTPGTSSDDAEHAATDRSAWLEASLLEGVGFRPFVSVTDVASYHRSLA